MSLSMRRLARTASVNFLRENLGIVLAFERCRSSHFGVLTQIRHLRSFCLALGVRAYHRWIPSELNESNRGTRTSAEQNSKLVTDLLEDQHSELHSKRERHLRPPSFQHRVNSFEKSCDLPAAMVGSNFEQDAHRDRLEAPRRFVRMRKLLAPVVVLGEASCGPVGRAKRQRWKSRDDDSDSSETSLQTIGKKRSQRKLTARQARRRSRVHADLLKFASAQTMLENLAVTARTRMRYTRSREKVFSLLDFTEHTMMELTGGCHAGPEKVRSVHSTVLGRANDGGILRRLPCIQPDGSSETTAYPPGLESLATSHTQPATQSMLECWAAICWRFVERGQVQMALCVLLGLSASSRPSTLLATRRCDLVKRKALCKVVNSSAK